MEITSFCLYCCPMLVIPECWSCLVYNKYLHKLWKSNKDIQITIDRKNRERKCVTFNRTVGYIIVLDLFVVWLVYELVNINSSIGGNIFLSLLLSNFGYFETLVMPRFVISNYINYYNLFWTYITFDKKNLIWFYQMEV